MCQNLHNKRHSPFLYYKKYSNKNTRRDRRRYKSQREIYQPVQTKNYGTFAK